VGDCWKEKKDTKFWHFFESDNYSNSVWTGGKTSNLTEDALNQVSKFKKRYSSF
jgi:ribosomal protein L31